MSRVSRRKKKISESSHIGGKSVRFHWGDYSLVEADVDWISGDTDLCDRQNAQKLSLLKIDFFSSNNMKLKYWTLIVRVKIDLPVSKAPLVGEQTCWLKSEQTRWEMTFAGISISIFWKNVGIFSQGPDPSSSKKHKSVACLFVC